MTTVQIGWPLGALLIVLAVHAAAVTRLAALGSMRHPLVAAARAVVQLLAGSTVIGVVLTSMVRTTLFLLVKIIVAAGTSARRIIGSTGRRGWWTVVSILAAVVPTMAIIMISSVVPVVPTAVLPTAGILIGGAMTATTCQPSGWATNSIPTTALMRQVCSWG